jgi:hypothetical protein
MPEAAKGKARVSIQNVLFATDLSHASAPPIPYVRNIGACPAIKRRFS